MQETDLTLADVLPVELTRVYRTGDPVARAFGIGTTHLDDTFLVGDVLPYTYIDLILPHGGPIHYSHISPGTSAPDAVYQHSSSAGPFAGPGSPARSLEAFVTEAYYVEQGVTSERFPEERGNPPADCLLNPTPEDRVSTSAHRPLDVPSNVSLLAFYVRMLNPPAPANGAAVRNGRAIFDQIGCGLCHTPELATGRSSWPSLAGQRAALYSDLLVHHMGASLADGITEGSAGDDEFRTPPLWGLGYRLFFLHDGRARNLVGAILAHSGRKAAEAREVTHRFAALPPSRQQELIDFLRSL